MTGGIQWSKATIIIGDLDMLASLPFYNFSTMKKPSYPVTIPLVAKLLKHIFMITEAFVKTS